MDVEERGWEGVDWVYVAQDWDGTVDGFLRTP
jgi:hypothetical protein